MIHVVRAFSIYAFGVRLTGIKETRNYEKIVSPTTLLKMADGGIHPLPPDPPLAVSMSKNR